MDPITHTLFGAAGAQAIMGRRLGRGAMLFGAAGGLLPDADVLWGGWLADPALPWEHHRHFTHALAFIPVGGLLAAAPLLLLFKRFRPQAGAAYLAATIGCATHGVNDAATSFGTYLYWPFSNERIAWDLMSIIDPIFTGALAIGIIIALVRGTALPAMIAFAFCLLYYGMGFVQNQRALTVQESLAEARGHEIDRGRAMPTLGNMIVWRSVYEADGQLHADAVRVPFVGRSRVRQGERVPVLEADGLPGEDELPGAAERLVQVFDGFAHFADDYVAWLPDREGEAIGDMRYALVNHRFDPLWGLVIDPDDANEPVRWEGLGTDLRDRRWDALAHLWRDIFRPDETFLSVEDAKRRAGE